MLNPQKRWLWGFVPKPADRRFFPPVQTGGRGIRSRPEKAFWDQGPARASGIQYHRPSDPICTRHHPIWSRRHL